MTLSDRHKGIGGDGIVLISRSGIADAKMRIFNADGSEAGMCGNAIRCTAKYLYDNGIVRKEQMRIETMSGTRELHVFVENGTVSSVKADMGRAELQPSKIPVDLPGERVIMRSVMIGGKEYEITCVSMGNPHAVVFCNSVDMLPLHEIGPSFEHDRLFPDRINVEIVEISGVNSLKMRVWERGSGETQACGTGACAAVVAAVLNRYCDKDNDISVQLPGGGLTVRYTDESVCMTGGCETVFDGRVDIPCE